MKNFNGIITALVTPFLEEDLDFASLKKLIQDQLAAGVRGFVVNGTTAESPTLEKEEVKKLIDVTAAETDDETSIIVGVGTNCTKTTLENCKQAEEWGADALLVVVPYYNKPTQEGLFQHFQKVAESTKLPVILYNVPGRTVVGFTAETVARLSKIENIIGIKEATGDMELYEQIRAQTSPEFLILSGDDATWSNMTARGGDGVISVISHIIAPAMIDFFKTENQSEESANQFNQKYNDLLEAVYSEPNPAGVKMALNKAGILDSPELRLPMLEMTEPGSSTLVDSMKGLGLLS